jgi:hypothetical protein
MTRSRVLPALALAAGLSLAAGALAQPPNVIPLTGQPKVIPIQPKPVQPQPVPGQPKGIGAVEPLATEIPVVPKSAAAFLSLKVSDVIDHPDLKPVLEQLKKSPEAFEGVTELFGMSPQAIDRVTLFWPAISSNGPGEPIVVLSTREPYNEARLLKVLRAEPVFNEDRGGRGRGGHGHDGPRFEAVPGAGGKIGPDGTYLPTNPGSSDRFLPSKGSSSGKGSGTGDPTLPPKESPVPPPIEKPEQPEDACTAGAIPGEPLFYELRGGPFELLFLVDDRTLVFLPGGHQSEFNMMALFAQLIQKKQTGPLADAIATAGNHTLAGGLYLPPMFREFDRHMPPELAPYAALVAARTGTITGDLGKTAKLTLKLSFDDAAAAKRAAPVLDEGLKTLAAKAAEHAADLKTSNRPGEKAMAPLLEAAATGMKNAAVKADGTTVTATTEIDAGPAAAKAVADLLQSMSSRKKFAARTNNLKQIGLALHNYHDTMGRLPMNVYGPKGDLLLSWRVELLPYLEYDNLYKQFKMDEAWDGPNNKKLIEQMPKVYEIVGRDAPKGQTYFQAFLTPDPARPPAKGEKPFNGRSWLVAGGKTRMALQNIPDGTSNTLGVVEAREGVIWSKPDDLPFGEKLPPLGEDKADVFMVLMLDGSVRAISTKIKPEILRLLIDAQDGIPIPDEAFDDRPRRPIRGDVPPAGGAGENPTAPAKPPGLGDLRQLEIDLQVALAEADKAKLVAELHAVVAAQTAEAFKKGLVKKEEVAQAEAELMKAQVGARIAETRVREIEDQIARAKRFLKEGESRPPEKK